MSRRKRGAIFALAGIFVAAAAAWLAGSERSLTERSERLPGAANGSELRRTHWTETAVVLPDGRRRIEVAGGNREEPSCC